MTDKDTEMFKALHQTETGRWLGDYLQRLSNKVCDVRYKPGTDTEARLLASKIIEEELIDNLVLQNKKKKEADRLKDSFQ